MTEDNKQVDRRGFIAGGVRVAGAVGLGAVGLGGVAGLLGTQKSQSEEYVWQLDPDKCMACTNCQTHCVLDESAVKCVQCFLMCGFCDICTGYFPTENYKLNTGAENHLCPTNALVRTFIEEQAGVRYFEYTIDEANCIGCGKCVAGCALMNGSLYLQVRHDRCVNCNECAIAVACPTQAFRRVPASEPNLLMKEAQALLDEKAQQG